MSEQIPTPEKKPALRTPWIVGAISASIVAMFGACRISFQELSVPFEYGDSGAGFAFWVLFCILYAVLVPISATAGGILGYVSGLILSAKDRLSSQVLPSIVGVIAGVAVAGATPLVMDMLSGSAAECPELSDQSATCFLLAGRGGTEDLAVSPDEERLLSASSYNAVYVWDAKSGEMIHLIEPEENPYEVDSVAWSPGGSMFAAGLHNSRIIIWDSSTLSQIRTLRGHSNAIWDLAWSPDGKWLASGSADDTARVWDVDKSTAIAILNGHSGAVNSLSWSPSSMYLATGSTDGSVKVWNVAQASRVADLRDHELAILSVAWSPDGSMLAAGSRDSTIVLWDTETWEPLHSLIGHTDRVTSVAWAPDSSHLASSSDDQTVTIWDAASGRRDLIFEGNPRSQDSQVFWIEGGEAVLSIWGGFVIVWSYSGQS